MVTNDDKTLKEEFEELAEKYARLFDKKHDMQFDGWVGDDAGTIGCFGDYFIGFDDIRLDIDENIPSNIFIEYYDYIMRIPEGGFKVNYRSYINGYRPYTDYELDELEKAMQRVETAKQQFEELLKNVHNGTAEPY